MSRIITIPAPVVRLLRHALLSELGAAAQLITMASFEPGRERHPEWFVPALEHSDACRELLAEIGCREPEEPHDAAIELDMHRTVLTTALCERCEVEHDFLASRPNESVGRQARQNIKDIEEFLTANGLTRANPPTLTVERWLRYHGQALVGEAARLAARLLDAYMHRTRRRRTAPDDLGARGRLAPQLPWDREGLHQ